MEHSRLFYVYGIVLISMAILQVQSDKDRRLLLHTADDIAAEFQMLRQEIEWLKLNQSKGIELLKVNQSKEIELLKVNQSKEIEWLNVNQSKEVEWLKANHSMEIQSLQAEFDVLKLRQIKDRGSSYIRWGRTVCPGNGTQKVYSGFTAGSPYEVNGGAASFVCLPDDPTWGKYQDGIQSNSGFISGTEYETSNAYVQLFPNNMYNEDAPCVLCHNSRSVTIMIPGRTNCYPSWTLEYTGYLLTGYHGHVAATDYACVDSNPEAVYHGEADLDGKRLYITEVKCGSLPCQVYPNGREIACVVCSK